MPHGVHGQREAHGQSGVQLVQEARGQGVRLTEIAPHGFYPSKAG